MLAKYKILEQAICLAVKAHHGQTDKQGVPYILHPLAVMSMCEGDPTMMTVAVLHDVVEDTHWSGEMLMQAGIPSEILFAIDALTKRKGESLSEYCGRVKANKIALYVKHQDVKHNLDSRRLKELPSDTAERLRRKYSKTLQYLQEAK